MRQTETIDRRAFDACLDRLDLDDAESLRAELADWQDGDNCELIEITTDCLGRIDSMSTPRPATE